MTKQIRYREIAVRDYKIAEYPLLEVERQEIAYVAACLKRLGIDVERGKVFNTGRLAIAPYKRSK